MKKIIATITTVFVMTVGLTGQAFALNEAPNSAPVNDRIRLELMMDLYESEAAEKGWVVKSQSISHISDGKNGYVWTVTAIDPTGRTRTDGTSFGSDALNALIQAIRDAS